MPAGKPPLRPPRARTTLPRLAVNATLAGVWATGLVALLVFFLNPGVRLTPSTYFPLALPMMVLIGPASGALWALFAGAVRLFATFRVRVPWLGFRPFWRFLVTDLFLVAGLYAHNLRQARDYLAPGMLAHLQGATAVLTVAAVLFAGDALWRGLSRRRLRATTLLAACLLLTGALFGIHGRYRDVQPRPSVSEIEPALAARGLLLVGLEGASPDELLPMAAGAALPQFRQLVMRGSSAPLASPRPPRHPAAWATLLTGRAPATHGITDGDVFTPPWGEPVFHLAPVGLGLRRLEHAGIVRFHPQKPAAPTVPTIDRILERCGYEVLASGWGGLIEREVPALPDDDGSKPGSPVPANLPESVAVRLEDLRRHLETARADPQGAPLFAALSGALDRDLSAARALLAATAKPPSAARVLLLRLRGVDRVAHVFFRYHRPEPFGNVTDEEIERYGRVMADYYRFVDAWLGALSTAAGEETSIVVVSPYAMRPIGLGARLAHAVSGTWYISGTHRDAGPGVWLAAGHDVRTGGRLERARAVDLIPTLLYLLDLPVGHDMDGQAIAAFASDRFNDTHALSAVPSWETVSVVRPTMLW